MTTPAAPHYRPPLLTDEDLTAEQRSWRPRTAEDLYFGILHWRVEVWPETLPDGSKTPSALQVENGSGPHSGLADGRLLAQRPARRVAGVARLAVPGRPHPARAD